MKILLTILAIFGRILLVLLILILLILLIVLFVPIRYSFQGRFEDPEVHEKALPPEPLSRLFGEADVSWILKAVRARAAYPEKPLIRAHVLFFEIPIEKFLQKEEKEESEKKEEGPKEEKPKKTIGQILEELPDKIDGLLYKKDYYLAVLSTNYAADALGKLRKELLSVLASVLPREWALAGTVGLGGPIGTAKLLEVIGYTWPVTAGHINITPDFEHYIFDLQCAGRGRIRIITIVIAGLRLFLNKNLRHLIKMLRRGPKKRVPAGAAEAEKSAGAA